MTRDEFDLFLLCSAILCLVMAIFNALRPRNRRYFLSGAFVAIGGALILHRQNTDPMAVYLAGGLAFLLLIGDLMVRARNQVIGGESK